ncbi:YfmQ family protein [Scopulibacillus cellulosilyticus]|uniref:YfmQ family protein n=1 Tax=Scopulibacillus cellulosilyticus TaxID=2665665 RepID=A0ABW2Q0E6_9BACL
MTWIVLAIILMGSVKIIASCLPSSVAKWATNKFALHPKISESNTIVTINEKRLEGKDKVQVINNFNKGIFLKRYYIHPGNEQYYLHPNNGKTPLVINITTKKDKNNVKLFIYSYNDHVDVIKQYKKKVTAYSLLSEGLQKRSMLVEGA